MTKISVGVERLSAEILGAYRAFELDRAEAGEVALKWAMSAEDESFAVARQDGRIVGISAYIKTGMTLNGNLRVGHQAVDSFVSSDMRGKGIFTRLARAYHDHAVRSGAGLIWGFPNDNAAHAWFHNLTWYEHGQLPFLIRPLRAGYFFRKLGLPFDFSIGWARDEHLSPVSTIGDWADALWADVSGKIGCGTIRNAHYLKHRLLDAPHARHYRIVADTDPRTASIVATRDARKHGGHIAYLMEALGGASLADLLRSELARLRETGVELVLAWSYPWSPNYRELRRAGFIPLPERLRPIRIRFGTQPLVDAAACANAPGQWYLSYLDSDTV